MNRRTFLKLAGLGSVSFAAGCSPESPKYLYSMVQAPEDMVTGKATWYASTCRECPAGCGVIAKNREGRVIKLEGNRVLGATGIGGVPEIGRGDGRGGHFAVVVPLDERLNPKSPPSAITGSPIHKLSHVVAPPQ